MTVYIGVDGGGTSTRALLVDREGTELGRAITEGAVATTRAPERAAAAVEKAVREAAAVAGASLPGAVLWAGLAGAGTATARDGVCAALSELGLAEHVHIGTDVEAAFHDAFPEGAGILLIAGTGSIAWLRTSGGKTRRVGGWGQHLGDEGSGYAIGLAGLRLVTRCADGRAAESVLSSELPAACGVRATDDLVRWVESAAKGEVAALAPVVIAAADGGDPGAEAIVDEAVHGLVAHVDAAERILGVEREPAPETSSVELVLWGGLVADGGPLRARVVEALGRGGRRVEPRSVDPVRGAAFLALEARRGL